MNKKKSDKLPVIFLNKKAFLLISALVLIGIIAGIALLIRPIKVIELPDAEAVTNAELEQYDDRMSIGKITLTDKADIEFLLSALSGARKTMHQSVHDAPLQTDYLSITLNLTDEMRRLYLYYRNGSHYIEEPYIAVYKINKSTSVEIYQIYTSK